ARAVGSGGSHVPYLAGASEVQCVGENHDNRTSFVAIAGREKGCAMNTPEPPTGRPPEEPGPPPPGTPPPSQTPPAAAFAASQTLTVTDPSGPQSPSYPAGFEITCPSELNRWLPLVKWLLVVPHLIVLFFVGIGAFFVLIYGFFAVLFTGRWPRGAFDYLVGTLRWTLRVIAYYHLM